jgi:predicted transport protein
MNMKFTKAERISLQLHPELNERWVENLVSSDPTILGLGDLTVRARQKIQPRAGRLDLLLEDADPDGERRYELELQLGATDESHIIRTIEYWDIERKRYPQYDHCAVLVAEDITSRFLNVISLFNGTIPLIALQVSAFKVGDHTTLVFTKVMDELKFAPDDSGAAPPTPTDREYWEKRATKSTVAMADEILSIVREIDPSLELQYNRHYIGIYRSGQPFNFCTLRPRKASIQVAIKLPRNDELDKRIEESDVETLSYSKWGAYRLSFEKGEIAPHQEFLLQLLKDAYKVRGAP